MFCYFKIICKTVSHYLSLYSVVAALLTIATPAQASTLAACTADGFQDLVRTTADAARVDFYELLSIVAHESRCRPYTIAWVEPGKIETAKNRFFDDLASARAFAQKLINSRRYRVDVGIGQINNEAHLQPKGWSLDEVLDPRIGLQRTAEVLRERGWSNYHSGEAGNAVIWQGATLKTLRKFYPRATLRSAPARPLTVAVREAAAASNEGGAPFVIMPAATPTQAFAPDTPVVATPSAAPTAKLPTQDTASNAALAAFSGDDLPRHPSASHTATPTQASAPALPPPPAAPTPIQSIYQAQPDEDTDSNAPIIVFGKKQ